MGGESGEMNKEEIKALQNRFSPLEQMSKPEQPS